MKTILTLVVVLILAGCNSAPIAGSSNAINDQVVEASCGQCNFDLDSPGCDLAVRIDGKAYFVDGANIDRFGDAHAADGFCNAVRTVRITGSIEDDRFQVTDMTLLPKDGK